MSPPPLAPVPAFPDCDRRLQGITQALTLLLSHPDVAQALPSALAILGETWQIDRLGLEPWYPEWFDGEGDLDPESLWLWQRHSETAGGRSPLNPALLPQIPEPWRRTLATGSPCLQALALGENPWLQQRGLEQLLLWPIDWVQPSQWRGVLSVAVAANPRGGTAAVGTTAVAGAAAIGTATGTAIAGSAAVAGPAAVGTATIGTTADTTTVGTATVGTATVGTATIGTTTDTAATDTAATDTAATDTAATDTARPRTAQALWTEAEVALWGQVAQALGGSVGRYQESQRLVQQVDRRTAELWQAIEELEAKAVDYEEAEAQLQANYTLLHSVINGTSDLIFVKDCQGRYVLVNDAALDFWQLPRKAVLGRDETLIFPPEEAQNLLAIDEDILSQGLSKTLEESVTLRGQTYTFLTTKTPYHDQWGQVIGLVGITRDITRRKQAENSLLQKTEELQAALGELQKTQSHLIHSEKMSSLGQLVAGVAHEINNPVNFIYGNTKPAESYILDLLNLIDLYQRHFPHPPTEIQDQIELIDLDFILEDLPKILRSIKVGAERIHDIVQSLHNFSRMNESNVKVVDIHEGIDSTLMILQPRLKALPNRESVILEKQYGPLPPVECYAGQLNQVIMNLLANALDAVDDRNSQEPNFQPHITIATHPIPGPQILIQITDNGVGIPDSLVSRLFDPFFTTKPVGKGTGMGLAISYQIITELHQGHLTVRSTPGLGTTFTIAIPQSQHLTLEPVP